MKIVTAAWCGPCKALKAQLKEKNIEVEFVDADEDRDFVTENNVKSVPTLVTGDGQLISGVDEIIEKLQEKEEQ